MTTFIRGIKTSEFWLGLAGVVLTYLNSYFHWNLPVAEVVAGLGVVATYIASRSYLKAKVSK